MDKKKESRDHLTDWEILQVILNENPNLKKRVLYRLRQLRKKTTAKGGDQESKK